MKVACTVWSGGKARDDIRGLPITIEQRFHLYAQSGRWRPADSRKAAQHFAASAFLCDPLRRGRGAAVLRQHDPALH